jgi:hypothetical protein
MENDSRFNSPIFVKIFFSLLLLPVFLDAQSLSKNFSKLSRPEKCWAIAHPFIAKKAFHITQQARAVTDSLSRNGILKDGNGGQLDAFRHAYWMASLVQKIPARKAEKLGKAHEKGNYLDWKKGMQEDSLRADSIMCVMDLLNNEKGRLMGIDFKSDTSSSKKTLVKIILDDVQNGKMVIVKKNVKGQPEDKNGRIIIAEDYKGKWYIPKVLVRSDYKEPNNSRQ